MAQASRTDRRRTRSAPRPESLEERRMMSVTFHAFPIAQSVAGTGPAPVINGLANGPDGALYFTYQNDSGTPAGTDIGRITPDGSFKLFPLPSGARTYYDIDSSGPGGITAGPDGAVWSSDTGNGAIDRTTPSGVVTAFPTTEIPFAITEGPDGNLWYLQAAPANFTLDQPFAIFNSVGRLTPSGSVTDYFAPETETSGLGSITAGPDGALWLALPRLDEILRVTTAGVITSLHTPSREASPTSITPGPDGALWFTEPSIGRIGRITTAGAFAEFPLPAGADPTSITSGPDGALWFTDAGDNALGRITTAGAVTETPIPNAAHNMPQTLVLGPDKNLWFTFATGTVVQAIISAAPAPTTTTVAATPDPAAPGEPILLMAVVTTPGTSHGTLTGTVTFTVDGTVEPPVALSSIENFNAAGLSLPSLPTGTHLVSALYSGDAAFASSMSASAQVVVSPSARAMTTTTVTAAPDPAADGQRIIVTAGVAIAARSTNTPPGVVHFFVDGAEVASTPLQLINTVSGLAQTVLPSLPAGTHQIVAMFAGDTSRAPSTSSAFLETVLAAPATDGPRVTSLRRYGFHAQPTLLVIAFDGPLAPATAQDAANYHVVGLVSPRGKGGRVDPVIAALYDATNDTVTLSIRNRLNVHLRYEMTVIGTAPDGVSSPAGVLLDGAGTGHPGSNYETVFGHEILAGPASALGRASQAHRTVGQRAPIAHHVASHRTVAPASWRWHARA